MTESGRSLIRRVSTRTADRMRRTLSVTGGAFTRRDTAAILGAVLVVYLTAFLYLIQDMQFDVPASVGIVSVATDPFATMMQSAPGTFMRQPIAVVELGVVTWQFSPVNTLLGIVIGVLVGLNLALSYLAITQPRSCGVGATAGVFAGVPALFAGGACCAPIIFLILGIQATGTLMTVFSWLLPVSILMLTVTLLYISGKIQLS